MIVCERYGGVVVGKKKNDSIITVISMVIRILPPSLLGWTLPKCGSLCQGKPILTHTLSYAFVCLFVSLEIIESKTTCLLFQPINYK